MKLKRFMLMYEPPRLGLEVQGEDHPRHKNLPAAGDVHSVQDVYRIVDELLASETGLLTRRKHRPALIKLLGRLYQVEVNEEGDAAGDGDTDAIGKKEASTPTPASQLQEGCSVVFIAMQNKQREHNGETGTIHRAIPEKGKFEVMLPSQEILKVKGTENIVPVAPQGTALVAGAYVVIRRLKNHTELNGCMGVITKCQEETQRFEVVSTASSQLFRVKQDNLVAVSPMEGQVDSKAAVAKQQSTASHPTREDVMNTASAATAAAKKVAAGAAPVAPAGAPPPPLTSVEGGGAGEIVVGSAVMLHSLKSAAQFNGQTAEVVSVDRTRNRYEIRMPDDSVKTVRAENVSLLTEADRQR